MRGRKTLGDKLTPIVIKHYTDGKSLSYISSVVGISEDEVFMRLRIFKSNSVQVVGNSYNDEIKKVIAKRDKNDISRSQIAKELGLSVTFVSKACKEFGDNLKNKARFNNQYTEIAEHDLPTCPDCASKRVNEVSSYISDRNTIGIYCMSCNGEFFKFINNKTLYRLNFEFDDED